MKLDKITLSHILIMMGGIENNSNLTHYRDYWNRLRDLIRQEMEKVNEPD